MMRLSLQIRPLSLRSSLATCTSCCNWNPKKHGTSWHGNTFHISGPLWEGPVVTGGSHKRPVVSSFDVSFDVNPNRMPNKQSSCRWFRRYDSHVMSPICVLSLDSFKHDVTQSCAQKKTSTRTRLRQSCSIQLLMRITCIHIKPRTTLPIWYHLLVTSLCQSPISTSPDANSPLC